MYSVAMRLASFQSLLGGVACAAFGFGAIAVSGHAAASSSAETATAAVTGPHFPTNEDLRHLKAMSAPVLSPDGKLVLFTVTEATADGGKTHLWLAAIGGSDKARQIT